MDTQNTPVHVRLWHRDFWLMAVASLLLTAAMYLPLPLLPAWMIQVYGCSPVEAAACTGLPGVGVFLLGCFCSYLVQRYRRNMVCIYSVVAVAVCFYVLQWLQGGAETAAGAFALWLLYGWCRGHCSVWRRWCCRARSLLILASRFAVLKPTIRRHGSRG